MKKYDVRIPFIVYVQISGIEAESEEEAEDLAFDEAYLSGYVGNGGTDKMLGVDGENMSVLYNTEPLIGECVLSSEVEESEG